MQGRSRHYAKAHTLERKLARWRSKGDTKFVCAICKYEYATASSLRNHHNLKHMVPSKLNAQGRSEAHPPLEQNNINITSHITNSPNA